MNLKPVKVDYNAIKEVEYQSTASKIDLDMQFGRATPESAFQTQMCSPQPTNEKDAKLLQKTERTDNSDEVDSYIIPSLKQKIEVPLHHKKAPSH